MPSAVPSVTTSSAPSACPESSDAMFYLTTNKNNVDVIKDCAWLQTQDATKINNVCSRTVPSVGPPIIQPAREVCLNTCGTCDKMNPSQSPSKMPSA
mmetsp:Transcript_7995/g.9283  ORF Transcript_7995/g.9283 Transcript_7995/m.9283 type:complete len:97 (-) Transcript_7995:269-559(-)